VPSRWRALFDLTVEMWFYLKAGNKILTETSLYQYRPFDTIANPVGY
jgi:glucans biosynthesis protein